MAKALPCSRLRGLSAVFTAAVLLLAPALLPAYQRHLSEDDVREAYLFGRHHNAQVTGFFDAYEKKVAHQGKPGDPSVHAIGVRTPYYAAALRSYLGSNSYSGRQAWNDYTAAASVFEVVVWIDIPTSYTGLAKFVDPGRPILQMFSVKAISEKREIALRKTTTFPQYLGGDTSALTGVELHFEYDVADVPPSPLHIEVRSTFGATVSADFDLATLR